MVEERKSKLHEDCWDFYRIFKGFMVRRKKIVIRKGYHFRICLVVLINLTNSDMLVGKLRRFRVLVRHFQRVPASQICRSGDVIQSLLLEIFGTEGTVLTHVRK